MKNNQSSRANFQHIWKNNDIEDGNGNDHSDDDGNSINNTPKSPPFPQSKTATKHETEANPNQHYHSYLLKSLSPAHPNKTYIGYTTNPHRRLRQHNGHLRSGGALRTRLSGRPWTFAVIVHGFPTSRDALAFEWAWQHPQKSKVFREEGCAGSVGLAGILGRKRGLRAKLELLRVLLCRCTPFCGVGYGTTSGGNLGSCNTIGDGGVQKGGLTLYFFDEDVRNMFLSLFPQDNGDYHGKQKHGKDNQERNGDCSSDDSLELHDFLPSSITCKVCSGVNEMPFWIDLQKMKKRKTKNNKASKKKEENKTLAAHCYSNSSMSDNDSDDEQHTYNEDEKVDDGKDKRNNKKNYSSPSDEEILQNSNMENSDENWLSLDVATDKHLLSYHSECKQMTTSYSRRKRTKKITGTKTKKSTNHHQFNNERKQTNNRKKKKNTRSQHGDALLEDMNNLSLENTGISNGITSLCISGEETISNDADDNDLDSYESFNIGNNYEKTKEVNCENGKDVSIVYLSDGSNSNGSIVDNQQDCEKINEIPSHHHERIENQSEFGHDHRFFSMDNDDSPILHQDENDYPSSVSQASDNTIEILLTPDRKAHRPRPNTSEIIQTNMECTKSMTTKMAAVNDVDVNITSLPQRRRPSSDSSSVEVEFTSMLLSPLQTVIADSEVLGTPNTLTFGNISDSDGTIDLCFT